MVRRAGRAAPYFLKKVMADLIAKGAFVLLVNLEFATPADAQTWLAAFTPLAQHCRDHEPKTLMYEAAVDDQVRDTRAPPQPVPRAPHSPPHRCRESNCLL